MVEDLKKSRWVVGTISAEELAELAQRCDFTAAVGHRADEEIVGEQAALPRSNNDRRQSFCCEGVTIEHSVVRHDSQFFDVGLAHEHAVEWISMYIRQTAGRQSVLYPDRQRPKTISDDGMFQVI